MRYLSLIELPRLSAFQKAALATYGERWSALRRSTSPVDRHEAEAGVAIAYEAAGLAPPREIIWGASPREIANLWVTAHDAGGENVRSVVVDLVRRKAEAAVDRAIGVAVRTALAEEPRLSRVPAFCTSIDEAVARDCASIKPTLRKRLAALISLRRRPSLGFPAASFGFQATSSLGVLEYFHDVCGLRRQTSALSGLWQVAKNAAWILPHERLCWLSERPTIIRSDTNGRLHAADGPALGFRDGWSVYAWKGVLVPPWIIERPERINVRSIAANHDPQIRRCMIDDSHTTTLYRRGRRLSGLAGRNRHFVAPTLALGSLGGRRGRQRHGGTRRHAQALFPAGPAHGQVRTRGRGLDLRADRTTLPSQIAHLTAAASCLPGGATFWRVDALPRSRHQVTRRGRGTGEGTP